MRNKFLSYLLSLENKGIKLGLERTEQMLQACGDPHQHVKSIQVVGTNGKGSTCAMISKILITAGYKVGLYTSPHLNTIYERIRINGCAINNIDIINFINQYKMNIDKLSVSFFEAMTTLAMWHFNNNKVDIAILETGLGGRLDSVSACNSQLIIFTQIALDHQHILGQSIKEIACEKAGAIRYNIPCLSITQHKTVQKILNNKINDLHGHIKYIQPQNSSMVNLNGRHQSLNEALAIEAVQSLKEFNIQDSHIDLGLSTVKWPGRIQKISNAPSIFFDVAHNETSCLCLCDFIKKLSITGKKFLIIALQQHKHIYNAIEPIVELVDTIILTQTNIRNFSSQHLKNSV